jgi:hypothetical protein
MATVASGRVLNTTPDRLCERCRRHLERPSDRRPLTLGDAAVWIAATGVSFGLFRAIDSQLGRLYSGPLKGVLLGIALLLTWTPALLALRLRRPRPVLRRLVRQPGVAALAAATTVLAVGALDTAIVAIVRLIRVTASSQTGPRMRVPRPPDPTWWIGPLAHFVPLIGFAVIGAWVLLALSGRRRPDPGWIDRLGRLLGVAWVALSLVVAFIQVWRFRS